MENANIAAKLVKVMADCSYVAKNGINSYHNYRYATAEDVLVKVNEALTNNHLACTVKPTIISFDEVTNLKGNKEHIATVSIHIEIIDSESGESVDFYGLGSGQDAGEDFRRVSFNICNTQGFRYRVREVSRDLGEHSC